MSEYRIPSDEAKMQAAARIADVNAYQKGVKFAKGELEGLMDALPPEGRKFWKENEVAAEYMYENEKEAPDRLRVALKPEVTAQLMDTMPKEGDLQRLFIVDKDKVLKGFRKEFNKIVVNKIVEFGTKPAKVPAGSELKDAPVEGLFSTIKASGKEAIAAVLGPIKSGYSRVTGAILNRKVQESKIHS